MTVGAGVGDGLGAGVGEGVSEGFADGLASAAVVGVTDGWGRRTPLEAPLEQPAISMIRPVPSHWRYITDTTPCAPASFQSRLIPLSHTVTSEN